MLSQPLKPARAVLPLLALALLVGLLPSAGRMVRRAAGPSGAERARLAANYSRLPLSFQPNRGQTDSRVRYLSQGQGYSLFLTGEGAVMRLSGGKSKDATVRMRLAGGNAAAKTAPAERLPGQVNYLIGKDPAKWHTHIPLFGKVAYREVYPKTDLLYYGNQQALEYDFRLKPGADPSRIRLQYEGAESVAVDEGGDLVLRTAAGELRHRRPVVYQELGGKRQEVAGNFVLRAPGEVGFALGSYDRRRELVIDPVLDYATFLGGRSADAAQGVAVDPNGNAYVTGATASNNYPVQGAVQANSGGGQDAFVSAVSQDATSLIYSTYLGGAGSDNGAAVAVDASGAAVVTGDTTSSDFPTTSTAFIPTRAASASGLDGFVSLLKADGSSFIYSTYLGDVSSQDDAGTAAAVDANGLIYIGGITMSATFPTTAGAIRTTLGGTTDGFLSIFDATKNGPASLASSTYLGGSALDVVQSLVVDTSNNIYVAGSTNSSDFPVTAGAAQSTLSGTADVYVAKVAPAAAAITWASLLGGAGKEQAGGVGVNSSGEVWVSGTTDSTDFPVIAGLQQNRSGPSDLFISRFVQDGSALGFSTYLGGSGDESVPGMALDATGQVFVAAQTNSANFPTTADAINATPVGGVDIAVVKLNANGSLGYSTYMGSTVGDSTGPNAVAADTSGCYVAGSTGDTFATTAAVFQTTFGGGNSDGFLMKITEPPPPTPPATPTNLKATPASSTEIDLTWTLNSTNAKTIEIQRTTAGAPFQTVASVNGNKTSYQDILLNPSTTYAYQVRAVNDVAASPYSNIAIGTTFPPPPAPPTQLKVTAIVPGALHLTWVDNSTGEIGFQIEQSSDNAINFFVVGNTGPDVQSFDATGLANNFTYYYRVRAANLGGFSGYSNLAFGKTLPAPPAAPTELTAVAQDYATILLTWQDRSNEEDEFVIERQTGNSPFAPVATVTANSTSYTDAGLVASTTYGYRVKATNSGGSSGYTNVAKATTPVSPPAAPDGLKVDSSSSSSVKLVWRDNSDDENGFKVERSSDGGTTFLEIGGVGPNVKTFTDVNLQGDATFLYRVRSYKPGSASDPSNTVTASTAPKAPSNLALSSAGGSEVQLDWKDNSATETVFQIERKTGTGAFTPLATVVQNTIKYVDSSTSAGVTYTYRVRAVSPAGPSAYSNEATTSTLPNAPSAPDNLAVAVLSQTELKLTWSDKSNNETRFEIQRSTDGGQTFTDLNTTAPNVATYTDSGLAPNTTYFYRVRAVNDGGASDYSTAASATTNPTAPAAPTGLTAAPDGSTQVSVNWSPVDPSAKTVRLERKASNSGSYAQIAALDATATNFSDTGLSPNTSYSYRLRASNGGGDSPYSSEATALTLPAAPSGLTARASAGRQVALSWKLGTGGADGVKIERRSNLDSTWGQIAVVGTGATSFTDGSFLGGTTFTYRVRAFNQSGNSPYSNEAGATLPTGLAGISVAPTSVKGGKTARGTVQLSGPAPAGGLRVTLSSSRGAAHVPASVLVKAGQSSASFKVKTTKVKHAVAATITGNGGGGQAQAALTVHK